MTGDRDPGPRPRTKDMDCSGICKVPWQVLSANSPTSCSDRRKDCHGDGPPRDAAAPFAATRARTLHFAHMLTRDEGPRTKDTDVDSRRPRSPRA